MEKSSDIKKTGLNKKIQVIIIAIVLLLAVAIVVCFKMFSTNYKKIAKHYVTAVETCNWQEAFKDMDLPESEFLTENTFAEANKNETVKEVRDISIVKGSNPIGRVKRKKTVTAVYSTESDENLTMDMVLKKEKGGYKITSDGFIYKNGHLRVPKYTTLYVNGVEVTEVYIESSGEYFTTYTIPYFYAGNNTIKITGDFISDFEIILDVNEDDYFKDDLFKELRISDEAKEELRQKAKTDVYALADARNRNLSFEEILSENNLKLTEYARASYEKMCKEYKNLEILELDDGKDYPDHPPFNPNIGFSQYGFIFHEKAEYSFNGSRTVITNMEEAICYTYVEGEWYIYYLNLYHTPI
ncbi:hypothetical protein [Lachnospira multipara]|uniref:hypothetical protein n=1 Tax=Lachnospira multipara TaxID=28051 RepID=UPI000485F854|nr:hypothetical protein [Lachnospira multipara]